MSERKSPPCAINAINAIISNPYFNSMQKHLLITIAAKLAYNGVSRIQFSSDELAQMMSCCVRSIRRLNGELARMGFLNVEPAFHSEDGAQLRSFYSLTDKISVNPKITKKV